ncbi:MAG TPA: acyl-CoA thioester hydrolase/BAAT C-terminal domain-containing protein [Candidatus Acidoferrum sp.]|nr:acyl-CoA thioester hydrolase/BAAT C-terminal domain-containing protein [Candidatus Acidoferrum sp.]
MATVEHLNPTAASFSRSIRLEVSPNPCFVDEEARITISGLEQREIVTLRAFATDDTGRRWCSYAAFKANESGCIDTRTDAAKSGTYRGVSPMGLFWSMHPEDGDENGRGLFAKNDEREDAVEIAAEVSGREVARAILRRRFVAPGAATRDLTVGRDGQGKVGKLFLPPGRGPHPAVIVVSGSGGGFDQDKAAVLSRHGFATLALAYFGIPPLPAWLHRIPLEYFESALAWLSSQPEVDEERIGMLGVSRGAELSLLLASLDSRIRAVAAYAPSHVAWAAGGRDKETREEIPVWTSGERPIPFARLPLRRFMLRSAIPVVAFHRPVVFRNLFRAGLRNRKEVERGAIAVERIAGPVLLISGGDDRVWPAGKMSKATVARLKKHYFPHGVEHLHYPGAGHMLRYPFLPTTPRFSRHAHLRNAKFVYGGTAEADAEADVDSWSRAVAFFQKSLSR